VRVEARTCAKALVSPLTEAQTHSVLPGVVRVHRLAQGLAKEDVLEDVELPSIGPGKGIEHALSLVGQGDKSSPAIGWILPSLHQAALHTALDQARHAVMSQLEPLRNIPDRDIRIGRVSADGQEQQMLLRRNTFRTCLLFREADKDAECVAKIRQIAIVAIA
jgi:hypothetical protein